MSLETVGFDRRWKERRELQRLETPCLMVLVDGLTSAITLAVISKAT